MWVILYFVLVLHDTVLLIFFIWFIFHQYLKTAAERYPSMQSYFHRKSTVRRGERSRACIHIHYHPPHHLSLYTLTHITVWHASGSNSVDDKFGIICLFGR